VNGGEDRRRRIAGAVCGLADERGMDGVRLRDVAERAGVSMGAVQRCFRTKDEMLLFALAAVGEGVRERLRTRLHRGAPPSAAEQLERAASEVALLADEHRAQARVWLAFVAQAAVQPRLAEVLRGDYDALQELFERLVAATGAPGARGRARTLLALADGLTTHVLVGHLSPEEAAEVLQSHLAGLGR
jgi:AcrR family transcriptional regulator